MLEVELNESLRRRRDELQAKLEFLGETDAGSTFSPEDLEARTRELKTLDKTIIQLRNKAIGMFSC